ncbi:MAG: malic enzyme-like NAD(P)-binding protein, partial [Gemmatimonadota bacterium]
GLGVVLSGANRVTDAMFAAAARRLASVVSDADLARGSILPPLGAIREVSAAIAQAVIEVARREGLSTLTFPSEPGAYVRAAMYQPEYPLYA